MGKCKKVTDESVLVVSPLGRLEPKSHPLLLTLLMSLPLSPLPGAMIIVSWNCRGLGHTSTVHELKALVQSNNPDCIFLAEIKVHPEMFEIHLRRWHFYNIVSVPTVGFAGGITFAWKNGV
ncbi:Endonuclease/exonuclease/phosphatase [Trema orientale]|uniref:Endonuclease/exonuclease/phosphatase n=1 Tax=Trema orientale TaxID=63057 RepID=A0A2P5BKQ9_TREOI|nr:Endonuclease/exonuclease/phosphatase [Trema orientale]